MTYEYTIEFFALEPRVPTDEASDTGRSMVYACGETGECAVRDLREEQMDLLQDFLNEMGHKGWELVQVLFNRHGAVSFWKKAIESFDNGKT